MIQITLKDKRPRTEQEIVGGLPPFSGYAPTDTAEEVWDNNRAAWTVSPERAHGHDRVLVVWRGMVVGLWVIDGVKATAQKGRFVFRGYPLEPGDAEYHRVIGRAAPTGFRNPVHYLTDEEAEGWHVLERVG